MTEPAPTVLVVGSGWRFTSGISYYTCRLTNALAAVTPTSAILMRRLVPRLLYPGRKRVGRRVNDLAYDPAVAVHDGVDWYWGRSMVTAIRLLVHRAPQVVILQWWTGAVLHSYLLLCAVARRRGARVVVEWHEVQDSGEARIPGTVRYVRAAMRALLRSVDAHVVHSAHDLALLQNAYGLDAGAVTIVPHGPYEHVSAGVDAAATSAASPSRAAEPFNLLFFGVIRPYKGLEDLVEAFDRLDPAVREEMLLTIVGEPWEGYDAPLQAVRRSPARERITVVDRYVSDAEVRSAFAAADAVVLPYRRSSSSGPLHVAMSAGLPVVVTAVGGLVEAARDYEGAVFVPPRDPDALATALTGLPDLRGRRYGDPHSWEASVAAYARVLSGIGVTPWSPTGPVGAQPA